MTPVINNTPYYRLSVPKLSGGVNLRDGISQIADNQLTQCSNVWFKNGILKTRPGIKFITGLTGEKYVTSHEIYGVYADSRNVRVINDITYFLVAFKYKDRLDFKYCPNTDAEIIDIASITDIPPTASYECNIFQYNTDIYCFCSGYYPECDTPFFIYKIYENLNKNSERVWECKRVTDDDLYIPVVGYNAGPYIEDGSQTSETDALEGYNLLSRRYRMFFSSALKKEVKIDSEYTEDKMIYELPNKASDFKGCKVIAEITETGGEVFKHTVEIYSDNLYHTESEPKGDGRIMQVYNNKIRFLDSSTGEIAKVSRKDFTANNIEVTAPCANSEENYRKVLDMMCFEWYGGGSEGLYGGVHLFLGGNINKSEKSLVVWSDLNKPLYFSENSYAYVGDRSQAVTAFAKQGEALIIFKERELFSTQYQSSDITDAESVINGGVVDIAASSVKFPMFQVHGFIGCDCPDTVQLCRNRLVWAHSDGKVYVLVSANSYNEMAVFEASGMVERDFDRKNLKSAKSTDWNGMYVLVTGKKMYLMDYNSYGYASITSYTKNDDAQLHIPWWIWKIPVNAERLITVSGNIYGFCSIKNRSYITPAIFTFNEELQSDEILNLSGKNSVFIQKEITTELQTKFFDFGVPAIKKSMPEAVAVFGANKGVPINVKIITENGLEVIRLFADNANKEKEFSPEYFINKVIRPINKHFFRVGIKFTSEGNMAIDAISLKYKRIGGAK